MYKKGQQVRMTMNDNCGGFKKGDIFTLTADSETRARFADNDGHERSRDRGFEIVESAPTITIEPGKHYRLRNGKVTGRVSTGDIGFEALVDGQVKVFDKAGGAVFGGEDIVEAWVPKVGERVRLVKDGLSTTGAIGKAATIRAWSDGEHFKWDRYLLDIDPPVNYRTRAVSENFTQATLDCFEPLLVAAPAQPAVWVPAVGDKVVWLEPFKASMYTKGKEYLIHKKERGSLFITDDNDNPEHGWSDDNILRSFSLAAPLRIQAGRYYKTRDGRKVGPMSDYRDSLHFDYVWRDNCGRTYKIDGAWSRTDGDLIAEWVDEPAPVTASNDNAPSTAGFTIPLVEDEPASEKDGSTQLTVRITSDFTELHEQIDYAFERLKKLKKKARKLGIELDFDKAA